MRLSLNPWPLREKINETRLKEQEARLTEDQFARQLAYDLGQTEFPVVSGLARGIDTAAHAGSIESGTIAVIAGGIDVVYPPENKALQEAIAERGLLIAEQPPGTEPRARHFPYRNRDMICFLKECLEVLHYLHKRGVVHRDINPLTVLLRSHGKVSPLNPPVFIGLSKSLVLHSRPLTVEDVVCGRYGYVAPEVVRAQQTEDISGVDLFKVDA